MAQLAGQGRVGEAAKQILGYLLLSSATLSRWEFDLRLNCARLGEAVGLPAGLGDTIDRIDVYNYPYMTGTDSIAWYDDILIK